MAENKYPTLEGARSRPNLPIDDLRTDRGASSYLELYYILGISYHFNTHDSTFHNSCIQEPHKNTFKLFTLMLSSFLGAAACATEEMLSRWASRHLERGCCTRSGRPHRCPHTGARQKAALPTTKRVEKNTGEQRTNDAQILEVACTCARTCVPS